MAIYAIGDVQGCYDELSRLIDKLKFDPADDELWFVGDLVNRGPRSLDVLRLVASLDKSATVTLGNHDLHLLAVAENPEAADTELVPIISADDAGELLDWLAHQRLAVYRPELNTLMVHAGVERSWDPLQTVKLAREVESALRGKRRVDFLRHMYGRQPDRWSKNLEGMDRLRFITNCLTRIRFCYADGRLEFDHKGPPGQQPNDLIPWFDLPDRATETVRIVYGHWASLGLLQRSNLLAIDTGCVWGRELTAIRLEGPSRIYSVQAS
jgi:bis(5'-nucleosyl)-tetraphosphatase (symmetrical)